MVGEVYAVGSAQSVGNGDLVSLKKMCVCVCFLCVVSLFVFFCVSCFFFLCVFFVSFLFFFVGAGASSKF